MLTLSPMVTLVLDLFSVSASVTAPPAKPPLPVLAWAKFFSFPSALTVIANPVIRLLLSILASILESVSTLAILADTANPAILVVSTSAL